MANSNETFVLVEMTVPAYKASEVKEMLDGGRMPELFIQRIVRTYLSNSRADEDLELLQEANPQAVYRVFPVLHIDN